MEITKILIYGFGRMGLTHFSILNKLFDSKEFHVVESDRKMRLLLGKNLNVHFHKDDQGLKEPFDLVVITTPPFVHVKLLENCLKRGDRKIFIEKPFGGHLNNEFIFNKNKSEVYVGYVLRFNPCIDWIKSNIDYSNIISISGEFLSNTISKRPNGWRNGPYSGVLNEMGSHLIDLLTYLINDSNITVEKSDYKSIYSDVEDILSAEMTSSKGIKISLYLDWVNKSVRKPVFSITITLSDGRYFIIDQQIIKAYDKSGSIIETISVTSLAETVPYYLRGIDFTKQMQCLIGSNSKLATASQALEVNKIMKKILMR